MDRATRGALLAVLLALAAGFLFFLGNNLFFGSEDLLLPQLRTEWLVRQAVLGLIDNLVPLVVAALLITYSIIINPESVASHATVVTSPFENIRGPLIILTVLAMGYTAVLGLVADRVEAEAGRLTALSESAVTYRDEATEALRRRETDQALRFLRLYQSIAGRRAEVIRADGGQPATVSQLIAEIEARVPESPREAVEEAVMQEDTPLTADENALRAQEFLLDGNYVNAHYYARRALELRPGWQKPLEIMNLARQNLDLPGEEVVETAERELFREKRAGLEAWEQAEVDVEDGYRALNRGKVVEAFLVFRSLIQRVPDDRDVQLYYEAARRALRNQALTVAEMTTNRNLPAAENILYAGRWEGSRGLLKIGTLVPRNTAAFAYDVEFMRFDDAGEVLEHLRADAGKLIDGTLYFRLVDEEPEVARITTTAEWLVGEPPEGEPLLAVGYAVDDLMLFSAAAGGSPTRGIAGQIRMLNQGPDAGYQSRPVAADLALSFTKPFALIVLSIGAIGFGWSHRSRYLRRPFVLLLPGVILAPFVVKVVYEIYLEAHRSIVLLVLRSLEFSTTLLVLAVVELALLFGAIFYLAREVNQSAS
ncbi:MAG: hypothetical protein ACLFPV_12450 [Spirochaetaceae bacterium]